MADEDEADELPHDEAKQVALELLLDAWEDALDKGVSPEILATTAIFAALTDMVDAYGEEAVAQMAETLPARIRSGEFTLAGEEH